MNYDNWLCTNQVFEDQQAESDAFDKYLEENEDKIIKQYCDSESTLTIEEWVDHHRYTLMDEWRVDCAERAEAARDDAGEARFEQEGDR